MNMKILESQNEELFVSLGSTPAYYKWDQMSSSVQFDELHKKNELTFVKVGSLKEASDTVSDYIKKHNLASSNWTGGQVVDDNRNFVAKVSYNGRIWDSENYPANEIV